MRLIWKWMKIILGGIFYSPPGHGPGLSAPMSSFCPTASEIADEVVARLKGDPE